MREQSDRSGYTLLELMLALALLGALMTVAWSLMGTYRDAEQPGWKLAQRTHIIRAAREWLQHDIQQLAYSAPVLNSSSLANSSPSNQLSNGSTANLIGDSFGFSATITPSLDPLPFLEILMSNSNVEDRDEPVVDLYSDEDATQQIAEQSPWSAERVQIEYQLTPIAVNRGDGSTVANEGLRTDEQEIQYTLARRERLSTGTNQNSMGFRNQTDTQPAADRVLSAQDLYRQQEPTSLNQGSILRESRLEGLTNVSFRYSDGETWLDEWRGSKADQLPSAIALCFDFPARADMVTPSESRADTARTGDFEVEELDSGLSFADSALATESLAEVSSAGELGLLESATSEVQIVVLIESKLPQTALPASASLEGVPR